MFRHILIDEMQDTNAVQVALVEAIARAGAGNLTAVGDDAQSIYRFRGANYDNILKFPERHPEARLFRLEINYRSTPEIVAFTNASIAHNASGFRQDARLGPAARVAPRRRPDGRRLRGGRLPLPADPRLPRAGRRAGPDGRALPQPPRQHPAPGRAGRAGDRLHGPERPPVLRAGAHQGRAGLPPDRGQPARRAGLAPAAPAPAGDRPGQGRRGLRPAPRRRRPAGGAGDRGDDGAGPGQEQGVLRRVRRRPAEDPGDGPRDQTRPRRSRRSSKGDIRRPSARSTSGPTTGSPTSSSSPSWPRGTTAWSG